MPITSPSRRGLFFFSRPFPDFARVFTHPRKGIHVLVVFFKPGFLSVRFCLPFEQYVEINFDAIKTTSRNRGCAMRLFNFKTSKYILMNK